MVLQQTGRGVFIYDVDGEQQIASREWVNNKNYATQNWVELQKYAYADQLNNYLKIENGVSLNGNQIIPSYKFFNHLRVNDNSDPETMWNADYREFTLNGIEGNIDGHWKSYTYPTASGQLALVSQVEATRTKTIHHLGFFDQTYPHVNDDRIGIMRFTGYFKFTGNEIISSWGQGFLISFNKGQDTGTGTLKSNVFDETTGSGIYGGTTVGAYLNNETQLVFRDPSKATTVEEWQEYFRTHDVRIIFKLRDPVGPSEAALPYEYQHELSKLIDAEVNDSILTITKDDGTKINFTGGGGGGSSFNGLKDFNSISPSSGLSSQANSITGATSIAGETMIKSTPTGYGNIAIGRSNQSSTPTDPGDCDVNGAFNFAMGNKCKAWGLGCFAFGGSNLAGGKIDWSKLQRGTIDSDTSTFCVALGKNTSATGDSSLSAGTDTSAQGKYSVAFGQSTTTYHQNSVVVGYYTASPRANSFICGTYNSMAGDQAQTSFAVGNGADESHRKNAFEVHTDGLVQVCDGNKGLKIGGTILTEAKLQALLALLG